MFPFGLGPWESRALKNAEVHLRQLGRVNAGIADLNRNFSGIRGTLGKMIGELEDVRQAAKEGLAVQRQNLALQKAILARDLFQAQIEEFIYRTEKLTNDFERANCDCPSMTQYLLLQGVLETIVQSRIDTPLIRGRENKAAFEACVSKAKRMIRRLAELDDVKQAIKRARAEENERREVAARRSSEKERSLAAAKAKRLWWSMIGCSLLSAVAVGLILGKILLVVVWLAVLPPGIWLARSAARDIAKTRGNLDAVGNAKLVATSVSLVGLIVLLVIVSIRELE